MLLRLPLLLFLLLSLALGRAQYSVACVEKAGQASCANCCDVGAMSCCVASESKPAGVPVAVAPQAPEGQLVVEPSLVVVGLTLPPVVERPAIFKQHAARRPVLPLLDLNCIRLI